MRKADAHTFTYQYFLYSALKLENHRTTAINSTIFIITIFLKLRVHSIKMHICHALHIYYKVWCVFVCQHSNVQTLPCPPVLKLWDTQGYLWLPYDLVEVIKLIGETFEPKKYFMSFLPHYCHSFRITVIPSVLL